MPDADRPGVRAAVRAGLRKEGLERASLVDAHERGDVVVLARVSVDPAPDSREGFIGLLNSTLPTKRAIAQGVVRDGERVLLCELVYKQEWDLPGEAQTYSVYVDDRDGVWLTDFAADAIVHFDPVVPTFTTFELSGDPSNVRQMLGRPGEVWGAESAVDRLVVIRY